MFCGTGALDSSGFVGTMTLNVPLDCAQLIR